jgi:hypothetical protein
MNTKIVLTTLAGLVLFISGCGSSPQNLIVGKWEAGQGAVKITMEFYNDGKAKLGMFGQSIDATYKINGGDELEWTCNGETKKGKMKISGKELEISSDGNSIVYKRA